MPRVKPLRTLYEICLKNFGKHCIRTVLQNSSIRFPEDYHAERHQRKDLLLSDARQFADAYMIVSIKDDMLKFVIDDILQLRLNSYEAFLKGVKKEDVLWKLIGDFLVIFGGKGVQKLDFSYGVFNIEGILSQTVFQDILWASNLVSIKLPNVWSAEIVEKIGRYCQNLQHLDLTLQEPMQLYERVFSVRWPSLLRIASLGCLYGLQYTNNGVVKGNTGCPRLQTLVLPRSSNVDLKVVDHVVKMIEFMPDLHAVRNIDTCQVAARYMDKIGKLCCMKWTEFEEWDVKPNLVRERNDAFNSCLKGLFPKVRKYASFRNFVYQQSRFPYVQDLFDDLEVIEINAYYNIWLKNIKMASCLPGVKVLKLVLDEETVGISEIQTLSRTFPNLEKLILYTSCYIGSDCEDDAQKDIFFQRLHTLQLNGVVEIDVNFLKIVLEKCPTMRTLELFCPDSSVFYLGEDICITDNFVEELSPSMKNLEKVIFAENCQEVKEHLRLTYASVRTILSACPNIKCLGIIGEWTLTEADVNSIVSCINRNNWDLDLVHSIHSQE